jgi:hypothetical protein
MNECPECGARQEWKTKPDGIKFLLHPLGGCHAYIGNRLKRRCNLLKEFSTRAAGNKIYQNYLERGYKPLVFDRYVSCNLGGQRCLGFIVCVEAQKEMLVILSERKNNAQFIRQLSQPFFYREIASNKWELNTFNEMQGNEEKKYCCDVTEPENLPGWKKHFGDKNQAILDLGIE